MTRADITALQQRLAAAGFAVAVDGVYGPQTAEAYRRYLNGLAPTDPEPPPDQLPVPPAAKPWWQSNAVRGGVAQILVGGAAVAGLSADPQTVTQILDAVSTLMGTGAETDGILKWALAASGLVSGLLSLWGSIRRTAPIDHGLVLPGVRVGGVRELPRSNDEPAVAERSPLDNQFL